MVRRSHVEASALVIAGTDGPRKAAAQFTFAIARHAAVDLRQIFLGRVPTRTVDRLPAETLERMRASLEPLDIKITEHAAQQRLAYLRAMYEPYVGWLSDYFLMELPDWMPHPDVVDDWQTSPEGVAIFHPDGRSRASRQRRTPAERS